MQSLRYKATLCKGEKGGGLKLQNTRYVGKQEMGQVVTEIYGGEKMVMSEIVCRCVGVQK